MKKTLILGCILSFSVQFGTAEASASIPPDLAKAEWPTFTTRKIRLKLSQDKSLSLFVRNIKIIEINDQILLRGEVVNQREVDQIIRITASVAPYHHIYNELKIAQ